MIINHTCAYCDNLIIETGDGCLEWTYYRDEDGVLHSSGFWIVHNAGKSPLTYGQSIIGTDRKTNFCFNDINSKIKTADLNYILGYDIEEYFETRFPNEYRRNDIELRSCIEILKGFKGA